MSSLPFQLAPDILWPLIVIVVLAIASAFAYVVGYFVGVKDKGVSEQRSRKMQRSVLGGNFSEQVASFLPDFRKDLKASEARFIGNPSSPRSTGAVSQTPATISTCARFCASKKILSRRVIPTKPTSVASSSQATSGARKMQSKPRTPDTAIYPSTPRTHARACTFHDVDAKLFRVVFSRRGTSAEPRRC
jgi:hypothetical protein